MTLLATLFINMEFTSASDTEETDDFTRALDASLSQGRGLLVVFVGLLSEAAGARPHQVRSELVFQRRVKGLSLRGVVCMLCEIVCLFSEAARVRPHQVELGLQPLVKVGFATYVCSLCFVCLFE